jgi:hypothetical protein
VFNLVGRAYEPANAAELRNVVNVGARTGRSAHMQVSSALSLSIIDTLSATSSTAAKEAGTTRTVNYQMVDRIIRSIASCSDIGPLLLRSSSVGVSDVSNPPALCLKANIAGVVQLL